MERIPYLPFRFPSISPGSNTVNRWVFTLSLYAVAAILLGVGIAEYLKSRTHYYKQQQATSMIEKQNLHNDGQFSRTVAAFCIFFGVGFLGMAIYYAYKYLKPWAVQRVQQYRETMAAENEQEVTSEMNPLNGEQVHGENEQEVTSEMNPLNGEQVHGENEQEVTSEMNPLNGEQVHGENESETAL